jgi:hypothetical protein
MDLLKGGLINDESEFKMTRKEDSIMPRGCEEDFEEELEDDEEDTLGIPDVYWADDIRNIEDPILREKEIEAATELKEEQPRPLLEVLGKCLRSTLDQEIERIFRSLEWFYRAMHKEDISE